MNRKVNILNEDSRSQLIQRSKRGDNYKLDQSKGRNRWERRLHSKVSHSVSTYNSINMNKLFKENILDVNVLVNGETDDYIVRMSFAGFLDYLHNQLKVNNGEFNTRVVNRALVSAFNSDQVYIHCSCLHPDTKIRLLDGTFPTVAELLERYEAGEKLYTYSVDNNGDFKPGEIEKVWITDETSDFIRVTLDNDQEIMTTPDHLYMLRDGSYKAAMNLGVGESLMPMYFNNWRNGYDGVKLNSTGKYHSVYKQVADYYFSDLINTTKDRVLESDRKRFRYDVAIHHKDFNKHNNNPDNFQIMTAKEHWEYHNSLSFNNRSEEFKENSRRAASENARKRNAHPTEAMILARNKWRDRGIARNYDEDRKIQQSEVMKKWHEEFYSAISDKDYQKIKDKIYTNEWKSKISGSHKKLWQNYSEEEYTHRCDINKNSLNKQCSKDPTLTVKEYIGKKVSESWAALSDEEKASRKINTSNAVKKAWAEHPEKFLTEARKESNKLIGQYIRTDESVYKCNLSKIGNVIQKIIDSGDVPSEHTYNKYRTNGYPKFTKCFDSWEELAQFYRLNHSVKKIERIQLETPIPVYDIKVKDYPNFLVDAGVILHNCPDWKYTMAGWATRNDIDAVKGEQPLLWLPSSMPSAQNGYKDRRRNPKDTKGAGCKHVLLVLSNNTWLMKVAMVIINYVKYMEKHSQKLYADIIYPAIYQQPYSDDVQLDMFSDDELATDETDIDTANKYAREKGRFQKGNQSGVQFTSPSKQISIDDVEEVEDEEI